MALGNHELNILTDDLKGGSGWFFDARTEKDAHYAPWHYVKEKEKTKLRTRLAEQPLLLECEDLHIVHAAWLPPQIERLEEAEDKSLIAQYRRFDAELKHRLQAASWYLDYLYGQTHYAPQAEDPDHAPPPISAIARYEFKRSRLHPIRTLINDMERLADKSFYVDGRWRGTTRCAW